MKRLPAVLLGAVIVLLLAGLPLSAAASAHPRIHPGGHVVTLPGITGNNDGNDLCWDEGGADCLHVSGPATDDVVRTEPYTYSGGYMAFEFVNAIGWYPGVTVSSSGAYPFTPGSGMNATYNGDLIVIGGFTNIVNDGGNSGCIGVDSSVNYVDVLERDCLFGHGATLVLQEDQYDAGDEVISVASSDHYGTPEFLNGGGNGIAASWVQPLSVCDGYNATCLWAPGTN